MTEYSSSDNKKNKTSDFAAIFSLILSHPLYFSYLIFFSPCLFKLLSYLSPLFITTSLLFLSLLTTFIPLRSVVDSKEGFVRSAYNTLLETLRPKFNDEGEESRPLEEFEVYKIVFGTPIVEMMEQTPDERVVLEDTPVGFSEKKALQEEPKAGDVVKKGSKVKEEVQKFEAFLTKSGSEVRGVAIKKDLKPKGGSLRLDHDKNLSEAFHQTVGSPPCLASFGSSARKEREWRRTLACKLFEERHNGGYCDINGGGNSEEGMDLLWETYETESNRGKTEEKNRNGRREKIDEESHYVGEEEEYDDDNGKICCLQALKLSAGKMNLGMGRPNLIKIGKAFKGIGWLQSHAKKQGKKGYK